MSKLQKLKGIYLHHVKYSENSVIAKIYTNELGMQSFMIHGVGKTKKNKKTGLLQPLTLLDIVAYVNPRRNIQQIKEISVAYHFKTLQQNNFVKSSIAIFVNELIYKSIKEEEKNEAMFNFLFNSVQYLDLIQGGCVNFHLLFAVKFSKYLGFFPAYSENDKDNFFDLREGFFTSSEPLHPDYISFEYSGKFRELITMDYSDAASLQVTNIQRRELLRFILSYYTFHLQGFAGIRSHHVLETVLS